MLTQGGEWMRMDGIYHILLLLLLVPGSGSLGQVCEQNGDCIDSNAVCTGTCVCDDGYVQENSECMAITTTMVMSNLAPTSAISSGTDSTTSDTQPTMTSGSDPTLTSDKQPTMHSDKQPTITSKTQPTMTSDMLPTMTSGSQPGMTADTQPTITADTQHTITSDTQHTMISDTQPTMISDTQPTITSDTQPTITSDTQLTITSDTQPTMISDTQPTITSDTQPTITSDTQLTITSDTQLTITSDTQPTITSDTKPTITSDTQLTITSDTQLTITSDTQPTITSDTKPTITSDTQLTITSDTQPTITSDTQPTITSDTQPTITSDTKPTITSDTQPTITSDTQLTITSDTQPTITSDTQPTITSDTKPTITSDTQPTMISDTQPTITSDTKPTITSDTQLTITSDTQPTITSDTQLTITSDTQPTITSDTQLTITSDTQPTRNSGSQPTMTLDMQPTVTSDMQPTMTLDMQITMSSDTQPTMTFGSQPTITSDTQPTMASDTQPTMTLGAESAFTYGTDSTMTLGTGYTEITETDSTLTFGPESTLTSGTESTMISQMDSSVNPLTDSTVTPMTKTGDARVTGDATDKTESFTDTLNTGRVTDMTGTGHVTEMVRAENVTNKLVNGSVTDMMRTGSVTDVTRIGNVTDVMGTTHVNEIKGREDSTDVMKTTNVIDAMRTGNITDMMKTTKVTDVIRPGSVTDAMRTEKSSLRLTSLGFSTETPSKTTANIDDCDSNPCKNGAECTDGVNSYTCTCLSGYTGTDCETNIDDCEPNPCMNGACTDGVDSYTCNCTTGYTGTNCKTNINDCTSDTCQNGGTCIDGVNSYTCSCPQNYVGKHCESHDEIDDCKPDPCMNGATCVDGKSSYTCNCKPGYTDTNCTTNINECDLAPCQNGASCTDGINFYKCTCLAGYTGTNCQTEINECDPNPCKNGGTCTDAVNSYTCACTLKYTGTNCASFQRVPNITHWMKHVECDGQLRVSEAVRPPRPMQVCAQDFLTAFYVTTVGSIIGTTKKLNDPAPSASKPAKTSNPSTNNTLHTICNRQGSKFEDEKVFFAPYWASTLECKNKSSQAIYAGSFSPGTEGFDRIMELLGSYIRQALPASSDGPTWILAAIWIGQTSSLEVANKTSEKHDKATFTSFIVMDDEFAGSVNTYAHGFSHIRTGLLKEASYPAHLGYCIRPNANADSGVKKMVEEYKYSGVDIKNAEVTRIQQISKYNQHGTLVENDPDAGVFIHQFCQSSKPHPYSVCETWLEEEKKNPPLDVNLAKKCPSTRQLYETMNGPSSNAKNTQARVCFKRRKSYPTDNPEEFLTTSCCYQGQSGSLASKGSHSECDGENLFIRKKNDEQDKLAYKACCFKYNGIFLNPNYCTRYLTYRPECTSENFTASKPASCNGDPHFVTADGFNYTMNGVGEYILLQRTSGQEECILQVRTEVVLNENGSPPKATGFSAVAGRYTYSPGVSVKAEFRLVPSQSDPEVKVVETLVNGTVVSDVTVRDVGVDTNDLKVTFDNGTYQMLFAPGGSDDVGITVKVKESAGMLALLVVLPSTWSGSTVGMMGDFDGNPNNDMKFKNGTPLADQRDEKSIFELAKTWYVDSSTSVFTYSPEKDYLYFRNDSFIPPFGVAELFNTQEDLQEAIKVCGAEDDLNCLFDFAATGSALVAAATQSAQQTATAEAETLANEPPTINIPPDFTYLRANMSTNLTHQLTATDPNGDDVTWSLMTSPEGAVIDKGTGLFVWAVPEVTSGVGLTVQVVDVKGASSTTNLKIQYCPCKEGKGVCQWQTEMTVNFLTVVCQCKTGWTGSSCDQDEDGCANFPCFTECTDIPAAQAQLHDDGRTDPKLGLDFLCAPCDEGMTGNGLTCGDINECELPSYPNGGCDQTCTNILGGYKCSCSESYTAIGKQCKDKDECLVANICGPNSVCTNTPGSYSCTCKDGYGDNNCEDLNECTTGDDDCDVTSTTCQNAPGTYQCLCKPGFAIDNTNSKRCNNIDECKQANNCTQVCLDTTGSYSCACSPGFEVKPGNPHDCQPSEFCSTEEELKCVGGQCAKNGTMVLCNCPASKQLSGANCVDKDECTLGLHGCDLGVSVCKNEDPGYSCTCLNGYKNKDTYTCIDVDECTELGGGGSPLHDCDTSQGVCANTVGTFSCSCNEGYQKVDNNVCEDVDECQTYPCHSKFGNCTNTPGGFSCRCDEGFEGDGFDCADMVQCATADRGGCEHTCTDIQGDYICGCNAGYEVNPDNKYKCQDIDECTLGSHTCISKEYCVNTTGDFTCTCSEGLELSANGKTCRPKEQCGDNHGCEYTCAYIGGNEVCQCQLGYELIMPEGKLCRDINECNGTNVDSLCPSDKNVKCENTNGSYTCVCVSDKYVKNGGGAECIDRDECQEANACVDELAKCKNEIGGYSCKCPEPLYTQNNLGMCEDVNECLRACKVTVPDTECNLCDSKNGYCTNMVPWYECGCNDGYKLKPDKQGCEDVDECLLNTHTCDLSLSQCHNVDGDFTCQCHAGYEQKPGTKLCQDTNECFTVGHGCEGRCMNYAGAYRCECAEDFRLAPDGRSCNLANECSEKETSETQCEHLCKIEGNEPTCVCYNSGYAQDGKNCTDIDECQRGDDDTDPACKGVEGETYKCNNMDGGYNCTCINDYKWGPTVHHCQDRDGGWSSWGDWGACTVTCGDGTQFRERHCNNHTKEGNGNNCIGEKGETQPCDFKTVPEKCPLSPQDAKSAVTIVLATTATLVTYRAHEKSVDAEMTTFLENSVNAYCRANISACCPYYGGDATKWVISEGAVKFAPVFEVDGKPWLAEKVTIRLSDPDCKIATKPMTVLSHLPLAALLDNTGTGAFISKMEATLSTVMRWAEFNVSVPQSEGNGTAVDIPTPAPPTQPPPPPPTTHTQPSTDQEGLVTVETGNGTALNATQGPDGDFGQPAWLIPVAVVCTLIAVGLLATVAALIIKKSNKVTDNAA